MNISLRIVNENPNQEDNSLLFIRIRGKGSNGIDREIISLKPFFKAAL